MRKDADKKHRYNTGKIKLVNTTCLSIGIFIRAETVQTNRTRGIFIVATFQRLKSFESI